MAVHIKKQMLCTLRSVYNLFNPHELTQLQCMTNLSQHCAWRSLTMLSVAVGERNECNNKTIQDGLHLCKTRRYSNHIINNTKGTSTHEQMWNGVSEKAGVEMVPKIPLLVMTSRLAVRHKSGGKNYTSDEESDLEELDEDDYEAPTNYKKMQLYLKSLRVDSVVSSGLDIGRNRVSEIFLQSRLRLNGEKLLKKNMQMDEGDYVDLITERNSDEDQLLVKRVKIIKVSSERSSKDKILVTVKAWKSAFPIEDTSKSNWKQSDS